MNKRLRPNLIQNSSGFIATEFLFAFVMVLGIGIFIFGMTFSLATIEVAQYIVWSTARNHSAGNVSAEAASANAKKKFQNLTAQFPLLTGNGGGGREWFELTDTDLKIGNLGDIDDLFIISMDDKKNSDRQPWIGARALINLKLFSGLKIPFLGKVTEDRDSFKFPIRAFVLRHPSRSECQNFFFDSGMRYNEGIKKLENNTLANELPMESSSAIPSGFDGNDGSFGEDNGC